MKIGLTADLSDGTWQDYNTTATIALSNNPATIYVQFKDAYNNTSSIVSTTTPITPVNMIIRDVSNLDTEDYQLFICWKIAAESSVGFARYKIYYSVDGSSFAQLTTINDRAQNYYLHQNLDGSTTYYYKVAVEDNDGNVSPFSTTVSENPNGQGGTDTTPPTISNVVASAVTTTQAVISWDTDELSDSKVEYITTTGGDFSSAVSIGSASMLNNESGAGKHQVTLTGLSPNTTYYYQVKSTDLSGNTQTAKEGVNGYSFTTLNGPLISEVSLQELEDTRVIISWKTDIESNSYVVYSTNADLSNSIEVGINDATKNHQVTITGLSTSTDYYYYVKSGIARDDNGGEYYHFKTTLTTDSTGPVISDVKVSDITYNSVIITWKTEEASSSLVDYGKTIDFKETHGNNTESVTTHTVQLSGLSSSTTYYFQVRSVDTYNNVSVDDNNGQGYSFTTLAGSADVDNDGIGEQLEDVSSEIESMIKNDGYTEEDVQTSLAEIQDITSDGPSVKITNNTTAVITWNTSKKAAGKVIYWQSGKSKNTAAILEESGGYIINHEIDLKNLNAQTEYKFYVVSEGVLGSTVQSEIETFTTGDTPQLSSISVGDITLDSAIISWTTNSVVSCAVEYGTSTKYGKKVTSSSSSSASDHTVKLTDLLPGQKYHFRIKGTDEDGETVTSNDYSFVTLELPQIANLRVKETTTEKAVIVWDTNTKTDSLVEYKAQGEKRGNSQGVLEAVTQHQVTLENLLPGTTYEAKVYSQDQFSNRSESETFYFTTKDDSNPPIINSVKSELTVFPGKESRVQAIISWITDKQSTSIIAYRKGALQDVNLEEYLKNSQGKEGEEYQGWKIIKNESYTQKHIFVMTDFQPSSVYYFKVASIDKRGNISISNNYSLLTPAKEKSVFDLIAKNFRETFGWMKKLSR